MNVSFFIARRFYGARMESSKASKPTLSIAVAGIAIGLGVMILTICILAGFKTHIREKVAGFGAHIEIMGSRASGSIESFPLDTPDSLIAKINDMPGVKSAKCFSLKTGMLKTDSDFQAMLLKGVEKDYDLSFVRQCIVEGNLPASGLDDKDIVMSRSMADNLGVKVGDKIFAYFFEQSMKTRRFTIKALFETNMERFDKSLVFGNMSAVSKLNGWSDGMSSGIDINVDDYAEVNAVAQRIREVTNMMISSDGDSYMVQTIEERYPQVFSWLSLLDLNMWVVLALMTAVAMFTMISGLLIIILERTSSIGTLKALGATNGQLRRVFLYFAVFIIGRGLLIGNVVALLLIFVQEKWEVFKFDPRTYYVDHIPVEFNVWIWLLLNVVVAVVTILSLLLPSLLVSRIQPAKAIRFD